MFHILARRQKSDRSVVHHRGRDHPPGSIMETPLTTTHLSLPSIDPAELFSAHHEALLRYLVRFTGDVDEAADAAQESYLKLVANPPAADRNARAWLFTVATNVVRDGWRHRKASRRILEVPAADLMGQAPVDPATNVERKDERRRARRALNRLSDKERTILLMREEGFSHGEIAEAVGTTTKSVGTMIARALTKFSRALSPVAEGPTP